MIAEYSVNLENKTKSELILFIKELQDMLKEKDKQIAKYEKIYKEYDCYRWAKELEKKDKMIDLMADNLVGMTFSDKENIEIIFDNKEDIKKYFERKVKNVKNKR